jgi:hypothetical protein
VGVKFHPAMSHIEENGLLERLGELLRKSTSINSVEIQKNGLGNFVVISSSGQVQGKTLSATLEAFLEKVEPK